MVERASFRADIKQSRKQLLRLDEPQVHHVLIDIKPGEQLPEERPPFNITIVIDRSSSIRGQRLEILRSAALSILENLDENDATSIISFSDTAEVVLPPDQAKDQSLARKRLSEIQAGGGTEIGIGISAGLAEIERNFLRNGINQLILFTDGHTYGDEELCLALADQSAEKGIIIHGIGIGSEWSDRFLTELANRTGGSVTLLDTTNAIPGIIQTICGIRDKIVASRLRLEGSVAQQVNLQKVFRIVPEPMRLNESLPVILGQLSREGVIRLLLELVIHQVEEINEMVLAQLIIDGDLLGMGADCKALSLEVRTPVTGEPEPDPPPKEIISALHLLNLYVEQEKALHDAKVGQTAQSARRLENLALHHRIISGSDEHELARMIFERRFGRGLPPFAIGAYSFVPKDLETLRLFFEEANRADQAFCLALIDIDHLAKYNDRFGHEAGDMLLENLAHLFQSSVGKDAVVNRSGEDEFILAFKTASLGGAKIRAERIRKDARRLTSQDSQGTSITPVTITLGLAFYPLHGSTLEELIGSAEYALLLGKSRGGDCVVPP